MKDICGAKIVCMALAALMFSLMLIPAGYAAIGVEEGDWAKYDIEVEIEVPEEMADTTGFEEMEEMEWVKAEVESISDTSVSYKMIIHYKNGTEETETIEDATENLLIEANLGEGDEVTIQFFGPEVTVYINGTVSRTYAGASREVNYVETTTEEYPMTSTVKAYWDKATGFVCEIFVSMSGEYEGETVEVSMSYKMTETNMWEAAPFWMEWWLWTIVAAGIVALAGAIYLLKKRKPPTPTAPTPSPEGTETSIE